VIAPTYLYPFRRRIEMCSAIYAGGLGLWVWVWAIHGERNALDWTGLDQREQLLMAQAMVLASLVHALGVRINGHWRWSPLLRVIGMSAHVTIMAWLAWTAALGSSATWTYSWVTGALAFGTVGAIRDFLAATGVIAWKPLS
jgi:hypothetical protein